MRKARRFVHQFASLAAYMLMGAAGLLTLFRNPSPTLLTQGGYLVVISWAAICVVSSVCGIVGLLRNRHLIRLIGAALAATASLTWAAALIIQATSGHPASYTAACLAGVMGLLFTQRWIDVYRQSRR